MDEIRIEGGSPLCGELEVQGSKNAVLPILAACLPGEGLCVLEHCPAITDVEDTLSILQTLGCRVSREGSTVSVDAAGCDRYKVPAKEATRIRSSFLFLGALLGRMKKACLPLPGGCAIGARPVDIHLAALSGAGAQISCGQDIFAVCTEPPGGHIRLSFPSVGATENVLLACAFSGRETHLENAAREPEIDELCAFLNLRGADIARQKDGSIVVRSRTQAHAARYHLRADRIVTGTYLLAASATGGTLRIRNGCGEELRALLEVLRQIGDRVECGEDGIFLQAGLRRHAVTAVQTEPYPGFPTDLQSPLMAALCCTEGVSRIRETIFENRFAAAQQLVRMGAEIAVEGNLAAITGRASLSGCAVDAADLRGGAALVIAALQARGVSQIRHTEYINRGYEDIRRDLRQLGARIF